MTPLLRRDAKHKRVCVSLAILIVAYLSLALTFSLLTRAWEANDEAAHTLYIELVLQDHSIPRISPANGIESSQPPAYYFVAAIWQRVLGIPTISLPPHLPIGRYTSGEHRAAVYLHELRLLSVVFGLGTVLLTYGAAKILGAGELLALSVGLFVALLPKELVVSSVVTNDSMAIMLCSLALVCFLLAERARNEGRSKPRRISAIAMGLVLGVAVLTKYNSLPIAGILLILLFWPAVKAMFIPRCNSEMSDNDPSSNLGTRVSLFVDFIAASAAFTVVSGWWFVRNYNQYGGVLASRASRVNVSVLTLGAYHAVNSYVLVLFRIVPVSLFHSIWYDGGENQLQLPGFLNAFLAAFGCLSIVVGAWALFSRGSRLLTLVAGLQSQALFGCILGGLIACILVAKSTAHVQGRLSYVGLSAFAVVAVAGPTWAVKQTKRHLAWLGMLTWPGVLLALDVYVLTHFVVPLGGL